MAKVYFYPAKLLFKAFIEKYFRPNPPTRADFDFLIFQSEIEDGNRRNDNYILTAYFMKQDRTVRYKLSSNIFVPDYEVNPHETTGKLYFANFHLSRDVIDTFVNSDPTGEFIEHIYFKPMAFPSQPMYISYEIYPVYADEPLFEKKLKSGATATYYLNPSPPANAGV